MLDDELRDALERRSQRAVGRGADAALDRARQRPTDNGGRQGSFVAALAVIGLIIGGIALAVALSGDDDEEADEAVEEPVLVPGVDPTPPVLPEDQAPLTATVTTQSRPRMLIVDGTANPGLGEAYLNTLLGRGGAFEFELAVLPVERNLTQVLQRGTGPTSQSGAELSGFNAGLIREWVAQDRALIDPDGAEVVIILGTDVVESWESFRREGCTDVALEFFACADSPPILHPPAEVRVLVANGSSVSGAAGAVTDQLMSDRGYMGLTPTNALEPASTSRAYYARAYELDARQIAQILDVPQDVVQPMPENPPVTDLAGAHVLVVLGADYGG